MYDMGGYWVDNSEGTRVSYAVGWSLKHLYAGTY